MFLLYLMLTSRDCMGYIQRPSSNSMVADSGVARLSAARGRP